MRTMRRRLPLVALVVSLAAVSLLPTLLFGTKPPSRPTTLDTDLTPLKKIFNDNADKVRFVAILSPT